MRTFLLSLSFASAAALSCGSALAAVGVSINIGEPNFYGRIDIGDAPPPRFIYPEAVVIVREPAQRLPPPIYLRVPPGHASHWKSHCAKYGACGRPVYFVQDDWYSNEYAPHYRKKHGHGDGGHDDGDHGNGKHGKGHQH
jgi:hypothetical protein